jgi:hypothetical protein
VRPRRKKGSSLVHKITQLFEEQDISTKLNSTKRRDWEAFENVCRNFLCNENAENYSAVVQELISSYSNISSKLHFSAFLF